MNIEIIANLDVSGGRSTVIDWIEGEFRDHISVCVMLKCLTVQIQNARSIYHYVFFLYNGAKLAAQNSP